MEVSTVQCPGCCSNVSMFHAASACCHVNIICHNGLKRESRYKAWDGGCRSKVAVPKTLSWLVVSISILTLVSCITDIYLNDPRLSACPRNGRPLSPVQQCPACTRASTGDVFLTERCWGWRVLQRRRRRCPNIQPGDCRPMVPWPRQPSPDWVALGRCRPHHHHQHLRTVPS